MNLQMNFSSIILFFALMSMASCFIYRNEDEIKDLAVAIKAEEIQQKKLENRPTFINLAPFEKKYLSNKRFWRFSSTDVNWYITKITESRDSELKRLSHIVFNAFIENDLKNVTVQNGFSDAQVEYFNKLNAVRLRGSWPTGLDYFEKILMINEDDKLKADLNKKLSAFAYEGEIGKDELTDDLLARLSSAVNISEDPIQKRSEKPSPETQASEEILMSNAEQLANKENKEKENKALDEEESKPNTQNSGSGIVLMSVIGVCLVFVIIYGVYQLASEAEVSDDLDDLDSLAV